MNKNAVPSLPFDLEITPLPSPKFTPWGFNITDEKPLHPVTPHRKRRLWRRWKLQDALRYRLGLTDFQAAYQSLITVFRQVPLVAYMHKQITNLMALDHRKLSTFIRYWDENRCLAYLLPRLHSCRLCYLFGLLAKWRSGTQLGFPAESLQARFEKFEEEKWERES